MDETRDTLRIRALKLYPLAVLWLGSIAEGRAAVIEAAAAAARRSPESPAEEMLPQLFRIGQTRVPERIESNDFPDDPALEPLRPILRLPAGSRRSLGISIAEISPAEAAAARGISEDELAQKTEKALRQLTFLQNGQQPQLSALQQAAWHLPWGEDDTQALYAAAEAVPQPDVSKAEMPKITRSDSQSAGRGRAVAVPVWGIVLGMVCISVLLAALLMQVAANKKAANPEVPRIVTSVQAQKLLNSSYLYIGEVQSRVQTDAGFAKAVFLRSKLQTENDPPTYEIECTDGRGINYVYTADAVSGEILSRSEKQSEQLPQCSDWLSAETLRQTALTRASLSDVLFLKEKFSADGEACSYKLDVLRTDGQLCTVHLDAKNAMLLRFDMQMPEQEKPEQTISAAEAQQKALAQADGLKPEQVIFTKTKLEGNLWLIEFSLDDGTEYQIELNAADGTVQSADAYPFSGSAGETAGLLAARDAAFRMAEISDASAVTFSKAKMDRSDGEYVYELKFETQQYEYEVMLRCSDVEVLQYRAIAK